MVKVIGLVEALQDIATVAIGDALALVAHLPQVNSQAFHLILLGARVATRARVVVRVEADAVQVGELVVTVHLVGGDIAREVGAIITGFQEVGIVRLHVSRVQARDTIKEMEAPTVAPRHESGIAGSVVRFVSIHAEGGLREIQLTYAAFAGMNGDRLHVRLEGLGVEERDLRGLRRVGGRLAIGHLVVAVGLREMGVRPVHAHIELRILGFIHHHPCMRFLGFPLRGIAGGEEEDAEAVEMGRRDGEAAVARLHISQDALAAWLCEFSMHAHLLAQRTFLGIETGCGDVAAHAVAAGREVGLTGIALRDDGLQDLALPHARILVFCGEVILRHLPQAVAETRNVCMVLQLLLHVEGRRATEVEGCLLVL